MQRIKNMYSYKANPDQAPCTVTLESGKTMEMNCSPNQFLKGFREYSKGALMQDAFPFLNAEEREFLMSGYTPEEWNIMFPQKNTED